MVFISAAIVVVVVVFAKIYKTFIFPCKELVRVLCMGMRINMKTIVSVYASGSVRVCV